MEAVKLLRTLNQRGFINSVTISRDTAIKKLSKPTTLYCGFDPTGSSLHVGHLLQIMCMAHFQRAGHKPIALVGGATALIGDPSGRNTERPLLTEEQVALNSAGIVESISNILDFSTNSSNPALLLNNYDWFKNMNLLGFMRDFGKLFKVQNMIAKDSVKSRLNDSFGISFTEFSYQLFQSYDFYHLFQSHNCVLQIGGSDQWGNITSGIDLIHKFHKPIQTLSPSSSITDKAILDTLHFNSVELNPNDSGASSQTESYYYESNAFGLTIPLLTTSDGKKIGKSVVNQKDTTIWLHPSKTSPYDFYQYFMNVKDDDVIRFLKFFTFLSIEEINEIEKQHFVQPEIRIAQSKLAEEITKIVHGDRGLQQAKEATEMLFKKGEIDLSKLTGPKFDIVKSEVVTLPLSELLVKTNLFTTKSEAKRMIKSGGIYVNEVRIDGTEYTITPKDFEVENRIILRKGKKTFVIVHVLEN